MPALPTQPQRSSIRNWEGFWLLSTQIRGQPPLKVRSNRSNLALLRLPARSCQNRLLWKIVESAGNTTFQFHRRLYKAKLTASFSPYTRTRFPVPEVRFPELTTTPRVSRPGSRPYRSRCNICRTSCVISTERNRYLLLWPVALWRNRAPWMTLGRQRLWVARTNSRQSPRPDPGRWNEVSETFSPIRCWRPHESHQRQRRSRSWPTPSQNFLAHEWPRSPERTESNSWHLWIVWRVRDICQSLRKRYDVHCARDWMPVTRVSVVFFALARLVEIFFTVWFGSCDPGHFVIASTS